MNVTATETMALYRALAPRIVLPDGTRPLMTKCEHRQLLFQQTCPDCGADQKDFGGIHENDFRRPIGYVPLTDLRQGVEVVPLGALLDLMTSISLEGTEDDWVCSRLQLGRHINYSATRIGRAERAVVLALTAAMDAREGK